MAAHEQYARQAAARGALGTGERVEALGGQVSELTGERGDDVPWPPRWPTPRAPATTRRRC
ncbi:hypothetical protein ACFVYF_04820 [Streptomyces sp. NPDC058274]|uniref:hypothetical protein n=1 Tax=Streptomyces sp. NPDC058274 TaxID=3346416 RepID=UPI0036E690AB